MSYVGLQVEWKIPRFPESRSVSVLKTCFFCCKVFLGIIIHQLPPCPHGGDYYIV